jgi:hypothetical protein
VQDLSQTSVPVPIERAENHPEMGENHSETGENHSKIAKNDPEALENPDIYEVSAEAREKAYRRHELEMFAFYRRYLIPTVISAQFEVESDL